MTDFRALCAELVEELAAETSLYPGHERGIVTRARAALAEPEPEGPTLAEVDDLCAEHSFHYEDDESLECLLLIITDALARWGRPAPEPVPVAWCRTDEFSNAMKRGGSFNGWKDPGAGANKCDMRLYALLPQPTSGKDFGR